MCLPKCGILAPNLNNNWMTVVIGKAQHTRNISDQGVGANNEMWLGCVLLGYHKAITYRPLGWERVYLPLCEVADTPFHIQRDDIYYRSHCNDSVYVTKMKLACAPHIVRMRAQSLQAIIASGPAIKRVAHSLLSARRLVRAQWNEWGFTPPLCTYKHTMLS